MAVKKLILYISVSFTLLAASVACGTKEEIPADLLTTEQMVGLQIDLHIAEAQAKKLNLRGDSAYVFFRYLQTDVYNQHGVIDSVYEKSYKWYLAHPQVWEQVYATVIDSLKARQQLAERPKKVNNKKLPPTSKD